MNKINSASIKYRPVLPKYSAVDGDPQINNFIKNVEKISNSNQDKTVAAASGKQKTMVNQLRFLDILICPNDIKHGIDGFKVPLSAIYGFEAQQEKVNLFLENLDMFHIVYKHLTIASLNHRKGLVPLSCDSYEIASEDAMIEKIVDLSKDIKSRETIDRNATECGKDYSEDLLDKWVDYLQTNKSRLDVFAYVNSKGYDVEKKESMIKKLILKNTRANVDSLFSFIKDKGVFSCKNISEAAVFLSEMYGSADLPKEHLFGLMSLIQKHFFRNSSKLGIDFFRENGVDIISSWNNSESDSNKKILVSDVHEKPYLDNKRRERAGNEVEEPITYSEIRHMERKHKKDTDGITRIFLNGESVEFASGIDSGEWIEKEQSELFDKVKICRPPRVKRRLL